MELNFQEMQAVYYMIVLAKLRLYYAYLEKNLRNFFIWPKLSCDKNTKLSPKNHQKLQYQNFMVSFLSNISEKYDEIFEVCLTFWKKVRGEMESEVVYKKLAFSFQENSDEYFSENKTTSRVEMKEVLIKVVYDTKQHLQEG